MFRERLRGLVQESGSQRAFARLLRENTFTGIDYSPRIGEWLSGKNLPGFESLQRIAAVTGVSMDWLAGFPVPKGRSERERVGDLARAFLEHVVRFNEAKASGRRRDGLADAVGGQLEERQQLSDDERARSAASDYEWPMPGDVLDNGTIVTNHSVFGLQLLKADPIGFLTRISERVVEEAEQWELNHQQVERDRVRADVERLMVLAPYVAEAENALTGTTSDVASVYSRLAHAALYPLEPSAQANLIAFARWLSDYRKQNAGFHALELELLKDVQDILAAQRDEGQRPLE